MHTVRTIITTICMRVHDCWLVLMTSVRWWRRTNNESASTKVKKKTLLQSKIPTSLQRFESMPFELAYNHHIPCFLTSNGRETQKEGPISIRNHNVPNFKKNSGCKVPEWILLSNVSIASHFPLSMGNSRSSQIRTRSKLFPSAFLAVHSGIPDASLLFFLRNRGL